MSEMDDHDVHDAGVTVVDLEECDGRNVVGVEKWGKAAEERKKGGVAGSAKSVDGTGGEKAERNNYHQKFAKGKEDKKGDDVVIVESVGGEGKKRCYGAAGRKGNNEDRAEEREREEKSSEGRKGGQKDDSDRVRGKGVASAGSSGAAKKRVAAGEEARKKATKEKEVEGNELSENVRRIMAEQGPAAIDDVIAELNKLKQQRKIESVQHEHFREELSYDVGTYSLCNEREDVYATANLIEQNWTVYQRLGNCLVDYLTVTAFQKYNEHNLKKNAGMVMSTYMKAFMSSVARVYVARDDPEEVRKLCGEVYRWRLDFSVSLGRKDAAIDGVTMGMIYAKHLHEECQKQMNNSQLGLEDYCALPKGMKYVLQLQSSKRGTFEDWIYIARSNFAEGHLGLFAARQFDCGTPIGVYVGRTLHRYDVPGGKNPSQERLNDDLNRTDVKFEPYTMVVRDKDCRLRIIEADPLPKWQRLGKSGCQDECVEVPMFMGMQFANDCLLPYRKDTKLASKAGREINIVAEEDGVIITRKRINPGEECYLNYDDDWRVAKEEDGDEKSNARKKGEAGKKRKRGNGRKPGAVKLGPKKATVSSSDRGRK
jgi:hypothetical protein